MRIAGVCAPADDMDDPTDSASAEGRTAVSQLFACLLSGPRQNMLTWDSLPHSCLFHCFPSTAVPFAIASTVRCPVPSTTATTPRLEPLECTRSRSDCAQASQRIQVLGRVPYEAPGNSETATVGHSTQWSAAGGQGSSRRLLSL